MRKIKLFATLILVAGVLACSCRTTDETAVYNKKYAKDYLHYILTQNTLFCPVLKMSEREKADGTAIFSQGYHKEVKTDESNVTIDVIPDRDSTWKVTGKTNDTEFTAIVRMTGRNQQGLCEWSATSSGKYDEQNGYTATIDFEIPATFYWKSTSTSYSVNYTLYCNGRYVLKTFKEGNFIESIDKTFTEETTY